MKKHKIPKQNKDLKRYAFLKQAKRAIGFCVYCAIFALAYLFYLQGELREPLHPLLLAIFVAAVLISGAFIFRMGSFLSERSVSGSIHSIKLTRNYGRGMTRSAGFSLDFHTFFKITVVGGIGKKHRVKVQLFDDGFDGYYAEGEKIAAFRGLNYPLSIDAELRGEHICAVCGVRCYDKDRGDGSFVRRDKGDLCPSCNHTMIDVGEMTQ
jgi:hypothetical protein